MDDSKRTFYDREYIEKLYVSYQENVVDDNNKKKEGKKCLPINSFIISVCICNNTNAMCEIDIELYRMKKYIKQNSTQFI